MNPNAITTTVKPQTISAAATDFGTKLQIADYLIKSGFLPQSLKTVPQVVTVMMMSEELGIGYWQGFNGINVIQGKPTTSPQLMLAMIYQSGNAEEIRIEVSDNTATCAMKRRGMSEHVETFSMADADKLGLANKQNWRQQPQVMLKWRVVAACARVVFPDVIMGMYTAEELGATVNYDDTGNEVVIVTSDPDPEPPTTPPTPPSSPTPPVKDEKPELVVVERTDITPRDDEPMARVAGAEPLTPEQVDDAKRRLGNKHSIDANQRKPKADKETKTFECVKVNIIDRKDGTNGEGGGRKYQFIGTGIAAESYSRKPLRDAGIADEDIPQVTGPWALPYPIRVTAEATDKDGKRYWNAVDAEKVE